MTARFWFPQCINTILQLKLQKLFIFELITGKITCMSSLFASRYVHILDVSNFVEKVSFDFVVCQLLDAQWQRIFVSNFEIIVFYFYKSFKTAGIIRICQRSVKFCYFHLVLAESLFYSIDLINVFIALINPLFRLLIGNIMTVHLLLD